MSNPILYVFDFDGVICDSTNECLLNSLNAYNSFKKNNKPKIYDIENVDKNLVDDFKIIRPYIKGATEYLKFYDYYSSTKDINEIEFINFENNDLNYKKYSQIFYNEREFFKKTNIEEWVKLNFVFENVKNFLNSLPEYYIATLKDKESVIDILKFNKINFDLNKILDFKDISSKLEALNKIKIINKLEKKDLIFIDDNAFHLIEPKKEGYNTFLSNWTDLNVQKHIEIAKENGINILDNIFDINEKNCWNTS